MNADYIPLIKNFIFKEKSLLIAPAGYGKTHTIVECLKYTKGRQLILTHTHAGVASIKEKIKKAGISIEKFRVETIDSFAQKYVQAFYCGNEIPEQDEENYFNFIIQKATEIIKLKPVKKIIKISYSGLFVDEYQDCTISQHQFIITLADILPLHILGDPLQSIFGFKESVVNWTKDLNFINKNSIYCLNEPWRWKNTNPQLGEALKKIRELLKNDKDIDLKEFQSSIEVIKIKKENNIYKPKTEYNKNIWSILRNTQGDLLLIYPYFRNSSARKK